MVALNEPTQFPLVSVCLVPADTPQIRGVRPSDPALSPGAPVCEILRATRRLPITEDAD